MRTLHYWQKIQQVGGYRFWLAAAARIKREHFIRTRRSQAYAGIAQMQWHNSLESFLHKQQQPFLQPTIKRSVAVTLADQFASNCFDLLGSGNQCFSVIPWHTDFRLQAHDSRADSIFDSEAFYADISFLSPQGEGIYKDIKVPWELSRFQYAPILGYAYHLTGNDQYAYAVKKQIISWLACNPYLHGVNWMNPMEVAIRAANWITVWQWLHPFFLTDIPFCKQVICSLQDHMQFIEHNWEWYDGRTSNHYLSNLVGYAYLCWFFNDTKRWQYCFAQLKAELKWQLFDEGTSYEGSTRYHQLVTELFLHGFIIAKQMGEMIEKKIIDKLERMALFIDRCSPDGKEVITIGDDDSGSFMYNDLFSIDYLLQYIGGSIKKGKVGTFHYPQFGVSVIKTSDWHLTLRHHTYHPRQPSGHFHEDAGSITLSYNGIPILIDPGSYLYTASPYWRNQFRSCHMHNTVFPRNAQSLCTNDLFALLLPITDVSLMKTDQEITTKHTFFGNMVQRSIKFEDKGITITDESAVPLEWRFVFGPTITLELNDGDWLLLHNKVAILHIKSEIPFTRISSFFSPHYGLKQKVEGLQGESTNLGSFQIVYDLLM